MGPAATFGDGQPAKAASSFRIISARVKEPDTAAIMLAGWKYRRWKDTRSSRVSPFTEASVVKRFVKKSLP